MTSSNASVTSRPRSSWVMALGGLILIGLGLYFIFVRPALLPEDPRYMGTTLPAIRASVPGLEAWLVKVFWVMGGYMIATGLLTSTFALTIGREGRRGIGVVVAVAGLVSIGWMTAVNFMLDSDFKWLLVGLASPWPFALALMSGEGTRAPHEPEPGRPTPG